MNNEKQLQNDERVLGRVLSREQTEQVAGGTDPDVDSNNGGITTISRDSGVWGEGFKPYY